MRICSSGKFKAVEAYSRTSRPTNQRGASADQASQFCCDDAVVKPAGTGTARRRLTTFTTHAKQYRSGRDVPPTFCRLANGGVRGFYPHQPRVAQYSAAPLNLRG